MRRHTRIRALSLSAACALAASNLGATSATPALGGVNWPNHNNTSDETAYSPLAQINLSTIGKLGLAWSLDLPGEQMLEATPIEVDGTIYFTGSYDAVYAVQATSGKLLWKYDPELWKNDPDALGHGLPANRGVVYANGRIFVGLLSGKLLALDAKTGKIDWSIQSTPAGSFQSITGAPRVFDGRVIIGSGGAEWGARGAVTAYDQATGKQVWRFYVVPGTPAQNRGDPAMERAAATWKGPFWKTGTGGDPWDSITFDRGLNRIYIATANAAPYDPEERSPGGGDNLYTASIVAVDASTGKYVWHYQINPRDAWDFDATQQMALGDLTIGGKLHHVLMQAPKSGFLYVIDRDTGKLLSAGKIGKVTWADHIDIASGRPVEAAGIRYQHAPITLWPSPLGAHNWPSMSFSPQTGLVYIPYTQLGMRYEKLSGGKQDAMSQLKLTAETPGPLDGKGALVAYDPVRQKRAWIAQYENLWNGGTMATAGGLVFQGAADGNLYAYDAATGQRLWHFYVGVGIIAAPITYSIDGRQYVTVLAGYGASNILGDVMNAGWKFNAQPRRLLSFALNAHATLAPTAPADKTVHAVDNPAIKLDPAEVKIGEVQFMRCAGCHGLNAISAGAPAPDLRESQAALDLQSFTAIVHDGALLQGGMPRFGSLSPAQIHAIYVYVRSKAREALAQK